MLTAATFLLYAAVRGCTDTVRILLQYKADINKFGGCADDDTIPEYVTLHSPPLPSLFSSA